MAGFKTWFGAGRNRSRSHPFGVFFWIFLVLTIFLVGFGLNNLVRDFRTRSWPSVACEILESKVVPAGEATRFVPWLRYRYEYGGHIRLSDRIHREAEVSRETYADAEAALAAYPVGGHRTCRVNPADPSEAILETNFDFAIFVVSPFCMLIWAIYERVALADWLTRRRANRKGVDAPITDNAYLRSKLRGQYWLASLSLLMSFTLWSCFLGWPVFQKLRSSGWVTVPGRILNVGVGSETHHSGRSFKAAVHYVYHFAGNEYHGNRLDFSGELRLSYSATRDLLRSFVPGKDSSVFVNPSNPRESVLLRAVNPDWFLALFMTAWCGLSIVLACNATAMAFRPPAAALPWQKAGAKFASGPLRLRPENPPQLMFFLWLLGAITCFPLSCWLLYNPLRSLFEGQFDIAPLIYGVASLIGFVACAKKAAGLRHAIFATAPRITVHPGCPRPGDKLVVECTGLPRGATNVIVGLQGREEASITGLTQTIHGASREDKTQKLIFAMFPLDPEIRGSRELGGRFSGIIPIDAMHSFEGVRFKLRWRIQVQLTSANGKSLVYNYKIIVRPALAKAYERSARTA